MIFVIVGNGGKEEMEIAASDLLLKLQDLIWKEVGLVKI